MSAPFFLACSEHSMPARCALIDDRRSFRLAHVFATIEDRAARLSIVSLVEKIAAAVPRPKRRR